MTSEPYGPFAIDPAWRRRGPLAAPGALEATEESTAEPPPPAQGPETEPLSPRLELVYAVADLNELNQPSERAESIEPVEVSPSPPGEFIAPIEVNPPRPEEVPSPSPFKPDPPEPLEPPEVPYVPRVRRSGVELLVPYLAAAVAILAIGGAIYLDYLNQARFAAMSAELARIQAGLTTLSQQVGAGGGSEPVTDENTIAALLALQDRIARLETQQPPASVMAPQAAPAEELVTGSTPAAGGPSDDCIPVGTRFIAMAGDSYPICQTSEVVAVQQVMTEGVVLADGTMLIAGTPFPLQTPKCSLNLMSSEEGFADLRVTCL